MIKENTIKGRKENDPEWIKNVAIYVRSDKVEKQKKQLRELYFEYIQEGMKPKEAWEKAKNVLACFGW